MQLLSRAQYKYSSEREMKATQGWLTRALRGRLRGATVAYARRARALACRWAGNVLRAYALGAENPRCGTQILRS